ncbi:A/G-specific adenine glycosylase [Winogradskyella echinorum]|uniref:Adenine DNA glycosylase n=1 Tax=Winogradskyella echinorum TaxID=538189 RepID=A0ABR6XYD9_9FLAO|nr:A/G-specific adenine glycosylase [Winogradskyella echinorum]MBC3845486.1 A/G-specific adenine glycosylase [Winogradskyella echinorum]MBC5749834.1 A/G-specific adenine glycosylase [Winogradskyella echinorum]
MNFKKELINWYSINKRELPWRATQNPYYIWLSEIILQQTQVKQGLPYYNAFVKQYPSVFDLANASEEAVLKLWQGLGYYSRARNLHTSAKYIANELNGVFPNTYKDLLKLKGVGDYTASAIASISFNEVAAVVDGNVYRVLSRYFGINTPINSTEGIKEFKALASSLIDTEQPASYNQAIMEFGARQCKPQSPDCNICPINDGCIALQKNLVNALPVKLKKTKVTTKYFNFLVCIDKDKNILFEKRKQKGIWQNLYQFPLIESKKSLAAEDFHLLNLESTVLDSVDFDYALYNEADKVHKLSHQHLYTKFWIIEVEQLPETAISIKSLKKYPAPVLISSFIEEFNF